MSPASSVPTRYPAELLRALAERVFTHFEVPAADAQQAADVLLASDLRGIESHGVARLFHYAEQLRVGRINPRPQPQVLYQTPATATVDGDNGLGLVIGPWANRLAIDKAQAVGAAWVVVRNSNHFGIAGYYPLQAAPHDLIGWAMTNASALVAPTGSGERLLGTNPLAVAVPGYEEPPVVIDMATSAVAFGKIVLARYRQESIPEGWAVQADGSALTDPESFDDRAALMPLGGDTRTGGHKGFCLASLVDLFCGVVSGACWGPFAPMFFDLSSRGESGVGRGLGHCFAAQQLAGFGDANTIRRRVDAWIRRMRAARPAAAGTVVQIPGDPERQAEAERSTRGIPLNAVVENQLQELAKLVGISLEPLE